MQYFIDENNQTWAYEDDVLQDVIDATQTDNSVTFTRLTETEFQNKMAPNLADAKIIKLIEIQVAFSEAELLPVTAQGLQWNGGYINGARYKAAYDLSVLAELPTVSFKDTASTKHDLLLADAKNVLIAIGSDYLNKDIAQDDMKDAVNAATSQSALDAIAVSF